MRKKPALKKKPTAKKSALKKKPAAKKSALKKKPAAKKSAQKKKPAAKKKSALKKKPAATKSAARTKPARKKKAPAKKRVQAVPPQYGTVTPHLIVSPCSEAMAFYERAFGAKSKGAMPGPDGKIMHAEMKIGDSMIMLSDEMPMPMHTLQRRSPKNAGATTSGIMLYVKNVDAVFERAVAEGAVPVMPPEDMFWGDRYGQVEDPYGHVWAMATHLKDLSEKQMREAMASSMPAPQA